MKNFARFLVIATSLLLELPALAGNLPSGANLVPGQSIQSDNGQYRLVMQGDGNLVYYRLPGMNVRFNTQTQNNPGAWAAMQGDGNLAVYPSAGGSALWNAGVQSAGARLAAQDDGNLAIYSSSGQALWHIGADPIKDNPQLPGDVVGRSLNYPGLGWLGHIGFWDGQEVVEVLNEPPFVVQYSDLTNFKSRSEYWGKGSPNIPFFYVYGCYADRCGNGSYQFVTGRIDAVYRAFQIYALGADYTFTAIYTRARPKYSDSTYPMEKGVYRCDTFVVDLYAINGIATSRLNVNFLDDFNQAQSNWFHFIVGELRNTFLPSIIFNKLRAYTG
ncbi:MULTISPECIES: hypothetical protein [unclassified Variovorax]|uniref:hypothetical protein n=1 Tax=unclassified Variovorax TaxID=663243 RepID=UPI0008395E2A|nr:MULTISPECIES: hypothetical protein [unclassified Variovorax]PNG46822.1 hypothetical protein CHC06_07165 [Variovorax sp. B2]PNG48527.1 hypothetical protein CHC07_07703 [Variovorax sp. B4]VTV14640.1 D-mannose binding lectin [Variovorax sp. WDL1]